MNKGELVTEVAARTGLPRADVLQALETATEIIRTTVARGGRVTLVGFGTFERKARRPRMGRNPHTGEAVPIAATRVPAFQPGTRFKQAVLGPRRRPARRKTAPSRARQTRR